MIKPPLDSSFLPPAVWNRTYLRDAESSGGSREVHIALSTPTGLTSRFQTRVKAHDSANTPSTFRYLERIVKFLLWQRGGNTVQISGCDEVTRELAATYAPTGRRAFDYDLFSHKLFDSPLTISPCAKTDLPPENERASALGGHVNGCRIGFDLGGSDRKCAAVMDGRVVFSEEIPWAPYFEADPQYHINGINDSLQRAAAHLPQVDAIGGSAAGIYVNNEVRVSSLFRGVSDADFDAHIRPIFLNLQKDWNHVPFAVANDGEVTALAGSMSVNDGAVLGVSMGTSQAAGYCDAQGRITSWLNELAFAPVDYQEQAPVDEWSGDSGCGAQYFSQQAVARLAALAGFDFDETVSFADRLTHIQERLSSNDPRAITIFETIGVYFGYSLAHYANFYDLKNVMILGRVTSGTGGDLIMEHARKVLRKEFPELDQSIHLFMPDEKMKRHGQAVAAASLPALES